VAITARAPVGGEVLDDEAVLVHARRDRLQAGALDDARQVRRIGCRLRRAQDSP